MVKNKIGGKKHKKSKNMVVEDTKLELKSDGQEYGCIVRALGNGRFDIMCNDGKNRIGIMRGKDRKRQWYNKDSVVLVELWTDMTNSDKCSIIYKYSDKHVNELIDSNLINSKVLKLTDNGDSNIHSDLNDDDCPFEWDYSNDGDVLEQNKTSYNDIYTMVMSDGEDEGNEETNEININEI